MEELYVEGVATRDDPEPCVGVREGTGEASGWARAGRVTCRSIWRILV